MNRCSRHLIVAPTGWAEDKLQYRRHHLARYLLNEGEAEQIIWVYPLQLSWVKCLKALLQGTVLVTMPERGIIEIGIPDSKGMLALLEHLHKRILGKVVEQIGTDDSFWVWFTYPAFAGLIRLKQSAVVCYDCSDLWKAAGADKGLLGSLLFNWIKVPLIERTEKRICQSGKANFATSSLLQEQVKGYGVKCELVENGIDYEAFIKVKSDLKKPHWADNESATLGFVGGLKSWKIDFKLLRDLAMARKKWRLVIIGPEYGARTADLAELLMLDNVFREELVPWSELPGYLKHFDLGLLPYLDNEYNRAVFPLKLFEYLACGLPVVGCGLPSTVAHVGEGLYLHTDNCAESYIAGCATALKWHKQDKRRLVAAEAAGWQNKFRKMLALMGKS